MKSDPDLIISMTTIPSRLEQLKYVIESIVNQTIFDKVKYFYINLQDNMSEEQIQKYYDTYGNINEKIVFKVVDHKWRSACKLIPTLENHKDDVIITVDDDIKYPSDMLAALYNKWKLFPNTIVSIESNPITIVNNEIRYLFNMIDLKFEQIGFSKYLSNACLFCPNCFSDEIFDFEKFMKITNGFHDEIWFWINSTLNNVKSICLDYTYSLELDEDVTFPRDKDALSNINGKPDVNDGYNKRINEYYGEQLIAKIKENAIVFIVTNKNITGICNSLGTIHKLYGEFNIVFATTNIRLSWKKYLLYHLKNFNWAGQIRLI
jgi:hypothetical protein